MHKVLVLDWPQSTYLESLEVERSVLGRQAELDLCRVGDESEIDQRLEAADLIICWHKVKLSARSFARMTNCRALVCAAVGYDNIDIAAARSRGIPVATVPDYGTEEVADHAFALLLHIVRNLDATARACREGSWDWRVMGSIRRLRGLRLGLVGYGRIGIAVAARARAFGMLPVFYDPYVPTGTEKSLGVERAETLEELLGSCPVVSIHTPSSSKTRGMIGAAELAVMAEDAILINTARGDVIDQPALIAHLAAHPQFRAGLDVLANEPAIPAELQASPQVLLTAHSAWYADAAMIDLRRKSAETASRMLRNQPVATIVN